MSRKTKRRLYYPEAFRRVMCANIHTLVHAYKDVASIQEVADALGVTDQSVRNWCNGACCPTLHNATNLANFYEVPVDSLVGRAQSKKIKELIG